MIYARSFSDKIKRNLKSTSAKTASNFLLKYGYSSSSFRMPEYFTPSGFNKISLDKISWNKSLPYITKTLNIFTPKGKLSWRAFNFPHPYIYLHIVKEITEAKNWNKIKSLLTKETLVNSYSTPIFSLSTGETVNGKAILSWLQMAESDLIKDCVNYTFLTVTDIENFYPSIYTHSIAWAIEGKKRAKTKRYDNKLLGNRLDKLFQNSRDGQTNGIPVGSMISDIIAEIILIDVDEKLSERIVEEKLNNDVLICRYRDDYRIISKTEEQGKRVLQLLNRILNSEYDLRLNGNKTNTYPDIIESSFRPWMLEIKNSYLLREIYYNNMSNHRDSKYLKDCLVETYRIQKKFIDGRVSMTILTKLSEELFTNISSVKINKNDISEIISILRKIILLREEVTPQAITLLDILLKQIKTKKEKRAILSTIKKAISGKKDYEYQLLWFYRLCLSQLPEICDSLIKTNDIPLLQVMDRSYYRHDYEIFDKAKFSNNDKKQLEKFFLIDRKKLVSAKDMNMNPKSLNPFRY